MDKYKNDPTNEYETVKEYTNEDLYDAYASENKIPEVIENYINDLEKSIKKLRNELTRNTIGQNNQTKTAI